MAVAPEPFDDETLPAEVGPEEVLDPELEGAEPGLEGEASYFLYVSLTRDDQEGEEIAADAWEIDAESDEEAMVLAVEALAQEYGGDVGAEGLPEEWLPEEGFPPEGVPVGEEGLPPGPEEAPLI